MPAAALFIHLIKIFAELVNITESHFFITLL